MQVVVLAVASLTIAAVPLAVGVGLMGAYPGLRKPLGYASVAMTVLLFATELSARPHLVAPLPGQIVLAVLVLAFFVLGILGLFWEEHPEPKRPS